jgi:hypothetical protein
VTARPTGLSADHVPMRMNLAGFRSTGITRTVGKGALRAVPTRMRQRWARRALPTLLCWLRCGRSASPAGISRRRQLSKEVPPRRSRNLAVVYDPKLSILSTGHRLRGASVMLYFSSALAPFALFLPSSCRRADLTKLAVLGTLVTGFFLFTGKVWVPGGASQFAAYAEAMAHGATLPPEFAAWDAGYPLLIILAGYLLMQSFIPLFLLQAVFAVLLPLLVYEALRRLSPIEAYYTGLMSIITLGPIFFMTMIYFEYFRLWNSPISNRCRSQSHVRRRAAPQPPTAKSKGF